MLTFIIAGTTAVDDLLRSTIANFNHSLVSLSKSLEATGEICRLGDQKQLETPFFLPNNLVHWPTVSNVMMKLTLVDHHHQVPYICLFFGRGYSVLIGYKNNWAKYNVRAKGYLFWGRMCTIRSFWNESWQRGKFWNEKRADNSWANNIPESPIFAPSELSKRNQQNKAYLSPKSPNSAHYIA